VLVRAGAMRCATCGVVDPDGNATTEEVPPVVFAPPPPEAMRPLPAGVERKSGAWRIPLVVLATGGVFIGTRGALMGSEAWAGVAVVSALIALGISWDQIRRTFSG